MVVADDDESVRNCHLSSTIHGTTQQQLAAGAFTTPIQVAIMVVTLMPVVSTLIRKVVKLWSYKVVYGCIKVV